jgi:hypothetical protein
VIWLWTAACGDPCVEIPTECAPLYEPTWDAVYTNTVSSSCALAGCHGGGSAGGELALGDDPAAAYAALLEYVVPGDPACSAVVDHLEPTGIGDMPVGAPLGENERCAIREWIAAGAEGP